MTLQPLYQINDVFKKKDKLHDSFAFTDLINSFSYSNSIMSYNKDEGEAICFSITMSIKQLQHALFGCFCNKHSGKQKTITLPNVLYTTFTFVHLCFISKLYPMC